MKNSALSLSLLLIILLGVGAYNTDPTEKPSFELDWEEDFEKDELDTSVWTPVIGDGCPSLCGWGNNELQYYGDGEENVRVEDGILIIEAHKKVIKNSKFTSAKLVTKNKTDWKYGKIEVRAKLPQGRGTWPAIWMLPATKEKDLQWPDDGEIDIMEHVGYNQGMVYGTIHTKKYNGILDTQKSDSIYVADAHTEFHTYGIEWDSGAIRWYVDGKQFQELKKNNDGLDGWPFDQFKYYLIINLAVGGNWGGKHGVDHSIWPQRLEVDYVRYYKPVDN